MSLIGGVKSGVGGVRTTGGESAVPTPPVTGIQDLTSTGGTIAITSPTGPTTNIEVVAQPSPATLFDLVLSFGHGMDVDANLPALTSFWFSPTTIADLARANQVREWVTTDALAFLALVVRVDAAHLVTGGGSFVVTLNGADTAISLALAAGDTTNTTLQTSALFTVPAGSKVGVRWNGSAAADGSTLRAEIRLRGAATGTPIIPDTLPINPLALFPPENLALDGNTWTDAVAGHLYTCTVPPPIGPPPPGIHQVSGPTRVSDGSFNGHPYAHFTNYNGGDGFNYTNNMLATDVTMFARSVAPIPPRTFVAVVRPDTAIGGIVATSQWSSPSFKAALYKPAGDLLQAAYYTQAKDSVQTDSLVTAVNLAAQQVVLIWRTDGVTLDFYINGVLQALDTNVIGTDNAGVEGFCIGNLASASYSSRVGWRGDICYEGVWARKFTDAEVLSATANLSGLYVTP